MIDVKQLDSKQRTAYYALQAMPYGETVYHVAMRRRLVEGVSRFLDGLADLKAACMQSYSLMERVLGRDAFQAVMMVDHFDTVAERNCKMIAANIRHSRTQLDLETCERMIEERVSDQVSVCELKGLAQIRRVELLLQHPATA